MITMNAFNSHNSPRRIRHERCQRQWLYCCELVVIAVQVEGKQCGAPAPTFRELFHQGAFLFLLLSPPFTIRLAQTKPARSYDSSFNFSLSSNTARLILNAHQNIAQQHDQTQERARQAQGWTGGSLQSTQARTPQLRR